MIWSSEGGLVKRMRDAMPLPRGVRRRAVIAGIAALLTQTVHAQQREARIGVLMGSSADDAEGRARAAALVQQLAVLGWREGSNLAVDWRWAGGQRELFRRYAAELIALRPEVILASGSAASEALIEQTRIIPIVFAHVVDPIGQKFVANLAKPTGNVTGFSGFDPPMAGKWLDILTKITPPVQHVAVLFDPETTPYAGLMLRAVEEAAPSRSVAVRPAPVPSDDEIETAIASLARDERGGAIVLPGPFSNVHRASFINAAARYRVPAIYPYRFFAADGGLMSYGTDDVEVYRPVAAYMDRILKGARPGDLPVQNPSKFDFVINLKTAKATGLAIPTSLLAEANEVIE
jgi:putative ABC transport system substrate-binding protein